MKAAQGKETTSDEAQIREIIEDYAEGLRNKDADRCVANYADDLVQFDLAPPLENRGKENARKSLAEWFKTFDGPIGVEIEGLKISTGTDVAFAYSFNHISGTNTHGQKNDHWVRVTIGFERTDGKWLVNHEHVSVPFYMDGSFKAALDLTP
ncbi:MAG TPA: SgcJ/EcaC family oxidoreductase [Pyrinomonadaceae bacterium]|nr:SgcJ/EcaC family oxidoreductase [Pyrinomonadaceae bacterium]